MWEGPDEFATNSIVNGIFGPATISGHQHFNPAVRVDFPTGNIEILPRDLLDALAVELIRSRRTIARCERRGRFFIKTFSRDRYCSANCGTVARTEKQRNWMRDFRKAQQEAKDKSARTSDHRKSKPAKKGKSK
jgi:hypothetical protein